MTKTLGSDFLLPPIRTHRSLPVSTLQGIQTQRFEQVPYGPGVGSTHVEFEAADHNGSGHETCGGSERPRATRSGGEQAAAANPLRYAREGC